MAAAGYTHRFHHVGRFCFSDLSQGPPRQILTQGFLNSLALRLALLEWAWSGMRQVRRPVAIVSYLLVVSSFKPSEKYSSKFESSPNGSGWKQAKSWNHNLDNQIIVQQGSSVAKLPIYGSQVPPWARRPWYPNLAATPWHCGSFQRYHVRSIQGSCHSARKKTSWKTGLEILRK